MNKDEHIIIGFFIGILAGVFCSNFSEYFNFILYIFFIGLSLIGSISPDLIEPPLGRSHRRFFHSFLMVGVLIIIVIWLNAGNQSIITYLSTGFMLGYLSHLLLDATSRIGLPYIN
ncbi:MAG: metal-dependent hydrolase [Candidatus Hodarchaeales archaeon]